MKTTENGEFEKLSKNCEKEHKRTEPCNSNNGCLTCRFIINKNTIICNPTNKNYVNSGEGTYTCASDNVVYCIECQRCMKHYVGETTQTLRKRFGQHKNDVMKNKKGTFMVKHFNSLNHTVEDMRIFVLDEITETTEHVATKLRNAELTWIKILNSAYPFGLNQQIKQYGNIGDWDIDKSTNIYHPYFTIKIPGTTRKRGVRKRKKTSANNDVFLELEQLVNENDGHKIYKYLRCCSRKTLIKALKEVDGLENSNKLKLVVAGYSAGYFDSVKVTKKSEKPDRVAIPFTGSYIQKLNLERIFNSKQLHRIIGVPDQSRKRVEIIYTYNPTVGQTLYNFNSTLKNLTKHSLKAILENDCNCKTYKNYIYEPLGHVITGDNSICNNKQLETILNKGTNFRENKHTSMKLVVTEILRIVEDYSNILQNRHKLSNDKKLAYMNRVKKIIENNITISNNDWGYSKGIYRYKEIYQLKKDFIISPIDKATNNYAYTCKKLYILNIMKELGLHFENGMAKNRADLIDKTYQISDVTASGLLERHTNQCKTFNLNIESENQCIPVLYANPKLHKNPYKFRFIAGAYNSSIKPLSLILHRVLKHFKEHFVRYCRVSEKQSGKKLYIAVQSSYDIVNYLKNYNIKPMTGKSYDFSTLYTTLPHDIIILKLYSLVDLLFNNAGKKYVAVPKSKYGRTYYTTQYKDTKTHNFYDILEIKELIMLVISETYINFAGTNFIQKLGIPQGGNASPMIADLALSMMEFQFLNAKANIIPKDTAIFRYIDDILSINFDFDAIKDIMYPTELQLNTEQIINNKINYLDITIQMGDVNIELYNKTDVFNFTVIRSFSGNSCVHTRMIKGVIIGQCLRFCRLIHNFESWINTTKLYLHSLHRNGHTMDGIVEGLLQFTGKYNKELWKYNIHSKSQAIKRIINPSIQMLSPRI